MTVQFDPQTELEQAIERLMTLRTPSVCRGADAPTHETGVSAGFPDPVILWRATDERYLSRRFLEALTSEPKLLAELGESPVIQAFSGSRLSAASMRAVYRNLTKTENRLLEEGQISRKVVLYDWERYAEEGAGRYSLGVRDLADLDEALER